MDMSQCMYLWEDQVEPRLVSSCQYGAISSGGAMAPRQKWMVILTEISLQLR